MPSAETLDPSTQLPQHRAGVQVNQADQANNRVDGTDRLWRVTGNGGNGSVGERARRTVGRWPQVDAADGRPLRVLHFCDSLEPSGVGEHIYLLARELRAQGYEQALVCPDVPASQPLLERCAGLGLDVYGLCVRSAEDAHDSQRFVRLLRHSGYDLVHNHAGIAWEGCWGTFAAAEAGVAVVCTEHLPYMMPDPTGRPMKLRATRLLMGAIAVSHGIARTLLDAEVIAPDRLHVVWNGIDLSAFSRPWQPAARRSLLGLDPQRPLVVCVGRMTSQKRHDLLLDAIALVRRQAPDLAGLTLVLAGDGPLRENLVHQVARLGLEEMVRFLGSFTRVPELLSCADVFAQPSEFEGLPLAVLEGMAAGLPAVVTDTIGTNETVVHGQSGLVVPPDDPAALAGA
ncbi:MAG: glycosyltransferase family 4 protein, partial [Chloroflexota bacterium]